VSKDADATGIAFPWHRAHESAQLAAVRDDPAVAAADTAQAAATILAFRVPGLASHRIAPLSPLLM
jgi:hypothetical protein